MKTPTSSRESLRLRLPLIAAALVLAGGCGRDSTTGRAGPPPVPVQVSTAVKQALPVTLNAIGTVQTLRGVAVKSQVDGIIQSVHFREGDEVQAGELLVTLDRRPFENSLQMAKADLANARAESVRAAADAERYQRLDEASVVSKEQLAQLLTKAETTKSLVSSKEAAAANAELQLGYTGIRAPIAGRTGQLLLHEGALVKANDAAFSLVTINQLAPISVAFAVPERSLESVRAALAAGGVAVRVKGRDSVDVQEDGVLDFIDNAVDPTTGMITLKARFENADRKLWPGRFVNVELRLGTDADQIVVPTPAVQAGQQGPQVFVVKADQTVELRQVTIGRASAELTSLAAGVAAGETVVIDGQLRLVPGAKIEVRTLEEAARPAVTKQKQVSTGAAR